MTCRGTPFRPDTGGPTACVPRRSSASISTPRRSCSAGYAPRGGGSSGGPWLTGLSTTTGTGTLRSVNSYSYTTVKNNEYGPKFNGNTQNTYNAATSATNADVIVN